MGVINIRQATVDRGNIGNVTPVHIQDMGVPLRRVADSIARRNAATAAYKETMLDTVRKAGDTILGMADLYLREKDKEEWTKTQSDIMDATRRFDYEDDGVRSGSSAGSTQGAMSRGVTDALKWTEERTKKYDETVKDIFERNGFSGRQQNKFSRQLMEMRQGNIGRWSSFAADGQHRYATDENGREKKVLDKQIEMSGLTPELVGKIRENVRRGLELNGITDSKQIEQAEQMEAFRIVENFTKTNLAKLSSSVSEEEDSSKVKELFDGAIDLLKKDENGDGLIPDSALGGSSIREMLHGSNLKKAKEDAITAVKAAQKTAMNNAQYLFRQNSYHSKKDAQDIENDTMKKWDLAEQSGNPITDAMKADDIRKIVKINAEDYTGDDAAQYKMEKYDPSGYRYYQAKVDFYERKQKVAESKAEKALKKEADVDWDNAALDYLVMPKGDLTADEREKWLDDRRHFRTEFYNAFKRGEISREVASRVEGLMEKHFTAEQEDAVTHVLGRFGINVGLGQKFATVGAAVSDLKNKENGDTPALLGVKNGWLFDSEKRMGTQDLGKYISHFAYLLGKMPQGADLKQYAIECEDKIVSMYLDDQPLDEIMNAINIEFARAKSGEKMKQASAARDVNYLNLNKESK